MAFKLIMLTTCLALTACGGTRSTPVYSTAEFYKDDGLRSEALSACQADSEAALAANLKKPLCANAFAAQHRHDFNLGAPE